ncbi:MAG: hypothetical protein WDM77_02440 [Steroidobacteraceae bacterium]
MPLGGEDCRPNLFILVTSQPRELLQAMENKESRRDVRRSDPHDRRLVHRNSPPSACLYNTDMRTPEGIPPSAGLGGEAHVAGGGMGGMRVFNDIDRTSHILLSKIWVLANVYVVVDQARLQGVSRGQIADYIAMVSLAEIKPGGSLGDADTILRLFDAEPQAAPVGLSIWDQAFLKSLYNDPTRERRLRRR